MNHSRSSFPIVVQVGFAGSRRLVDHALPPDAQVLLEGMVQAHLEAKLGQLRRDLGLGPEHFVVAVSQIAIGADTMFTKACAAVDIPQRIFLPQPREEYLTARGSGGGLDFPPPAAQIARELLGSKLIIEERVVSTDLSRTVRFEETNLEIVRSCDVLICLVRASAEAKPGGSADLARIASRLQKPLLLIRVSEVEGTVRFAEEWQGLGPDRPFRLPHLPSELAPAGSERAGSDGAACIDFEGYCIGLKATTGRIARHYRDRFKRAAMIVIMAHLLATVIAVVALTAHDQGVAAEVIAAILAGEVTLLVTGLLVHRSVHRSHAMRTWAVARAASEVVRSVSAVGRIRVPLDFLFGMPFPEEFGLGPLLQTVKLLHLRSTRGASGDAWQAERDRYVSARLDDPRSGQIPYYQEQRDAARRQLSAAHRVFTICSCAAVVSVCAKLAVAWVGHGHLEVLAVVLGGLAIVLPVAAVGALSLAAAYDWAARVQTYTDMLDFLNEGARRLREVETRREFERHLVEVETRLLSETAIWASRRSFTGLA